ncbi:MAG: S8 family serine peptidase [Gammaproteobacteria bacterium]|nr:S8 family serine peptidase [Gammaproteobacteria bacterium]
MRFSIPAFELRFLILIMIALLASGAAIAQHAVAQGESRFSDDSLFVRFNHGAAAAEVATAHAESKAVVIKTSASIGVQLLQVPKGSAQAAVERYRRNPNVEFADLNYRRQLYRPTTTEGTEPGLGIANNFDEQYGLHNTGQQFGATVDPMFGTLIVPAYQASAGADINAPEAWNITNGSSAIGIAILDSGVACDHLDLDGKCLEQVNFVDEHGSTLEDVLAHGTHVAGIAAATTHNSIGIAGVGRDSSIGSLKTCWEDMSLVLYGIIIGQCDDDDIIDALMYAANSGRYHVINMSFAGPEFSSTLEAAMNFAWSSGLVLVAGSGNDYSQKVMYPAGYANVIGVGATDYHDNLSAFSSFGPWVSVLAPGSTILSTVPGAPCGQPAGEPSDCYDYKSGTSMATPHVAGLAALLWAHNPGSSNAQIRSSIESGADSNGALDQNLLAWSQHGRINMVTALGNNSDPTTHHVQSIVLATASAGRGSKRGQATVSIVDDLGSPVAGATVSGTFTGAFTETQAGVTGANGSVVLTTDATAKGGISFGMCVDSVVHGVTTYNSSGNTITCTSL